MSADTHTIFKCSPLEVAPWSEQSGKSPHTGSHSQLQTKDAWETVVAQSTEVILCLILLKITLEPLKKHHSGGPNLCDERNNAMKKNNAPVSGSFGSPSCSPGTGRAIQP